MDSPFVTDTRRAAEDAFNNGLYCAESVVQALAAAQGIESAVLPRIATAFCSGMGRMSGPCGALTGALMGLSLAHGRDRAGDTVQPAYDATQAMIRAFEQQFGARDCHQLLGCDLNTPAGQATFREQRLGQRCARYTAEAAAIAARLLEAADPPARC